MFNNKETLPVSLLKEGTIVKIGGFPVQLLDEVKVAGFFPEECIRSANDPEDGNLTDGEVTIPDSERE